MSMAHRPRRRLFATTSFLEMTTSGWETIRPWTNRIAIQVKELTSISATFILSSATATDADDGELAALHVADHTPQPSQKSVGETLNQGFTIKVNNGSWNNYFLSVEEDDGHGSEAVIILHGLRPGRHYEVELTLEQDENALRKDFATLDNDTGAFDPKNSVQRFIDYLPQCLRSRRLSITYIYQTRIYPTCRNSHPKPFPQENLHHPSRQSRHRLRNQSP
jgi:hypothetical protein